MFSINSCLIEEFKEIYAPLYQKLLTTPSYEYIELNSFASQDLLKKFHYIKNLQLSLHIGLYRYELTIYFILTSNMI